ncbi:MAG: type II toxin-antitoxin system RelE/ParE family toxin [Balneolales bacterium]
MTVRYHPEAARELRNAIEHYEEKREGLGAELFDEVEGILSQVSLFPDSGTPLSKSVQRILLDRFPFEIIYTISDKQTVFIYAIMHLRRKPGYWESRK